FLGTGAYFRGGKGSRQRIVPPVRRGGVRGVGKRSCRGAGRRGRYGEAFVSAPRAGNPTAAGAVGPAGHSRRPLAISGRSLAGKPAPRATTTTRQGFDRASKLLSNPKGDPS